MSRDLHLEDIESIRSLLFNKETSQQEILKSCYDKIDSNENLIRAWETITPIEMQHLENPNDSLSGLCIGIKDIFSTSELPTKMGTSEINWQMNKGGFDSRVVATLKTAGAIVVGKNKTSEFAVHKPTDTLNPRNPELTPGTSSSGSAAAVASGHVSVSIASQTAGSITRPSSYCGVIGFKPTFGEIPRTGVLKTTESFDTVGIIGNSISNIESVFEVVRVKGRNHPIHYNRSVTEKSELTILIAIGPTFDSASLWLRKKAISFVNLMFKHHKIINLENFSKINFLKLRECHNEIYAKEISYFLKNELSLDDISVELKNFFSYGKSISKFKYFSHLDFLNSQRKLSSFELKNSIVFSLSASDQAPKIGEPDKIDANLFWTSLGLPQLSLPLLKSESDNPIGLSLTGSKGSDINLLNLGKKLFPQYTDV